MGEAMNVNSTLYISPVSVHVHNIPLHPSPRPAEGFIRVQGHNPARKNIQGETEAREVRGDPQGDS